MERPGHSFLRLVLLALQRLDVLFQVDHRLVQAQQVHEDHVVGLDVLVQQVVVRCNAGGGDTEQKAGEAASKGTDFLGRARSGGGV